MNLQIGKNGKMYADDHEISYTTYNALKAIRDFVEYIEFNEGDIHITLHRSQNGHLPERLFEMGDATKIYAYLCRIREISPRISVMERLRRFNIDTNRLTSLPTLPESLDTLILSGNRIAYLTDLPETVKTMHLSRNPLCEWPEWPASLELLIACHVHAGDLPPWEHLPLKSVDLSHCRLKEVPPFPPTLKYLDISFNEIRELPPLPQGLKYLYALENNVLRPPELPPSIEYFSNRCTKW